MNTNKYLQIIGEALDRLEETVKSKSSESTNSVTATQYEEALGILTIEKSDLEHQLANKIKECEEWKNVYHEVVNRLSAVIDNMSSVLDMEHVDGR